MILNKLENKNFLNKAPKDVINNISKRSSKLLEEIATKQNAISRLK